MPRIVERGRSRISSIAPTPYTRGLPPRSDIDGQATRLTAIKDRRRRWRAARPAALHTALSPCVVRCGHTGAEYCAMSRARLSPYLGANPWPRRVGAHGADTSAHRTARHERQSERQQGEPILRCAISSGFPDPRRIVSIAPRHVRAVSDVSFDLHQGERSAGRASPAAGSPRLPLPAAADRATAGAILFRAVTFARLTPPEFPPPAICRSCPDPERSLHPPPCGGAIIAEPLRLLGLTAFEMTERVAELCAREAQPRALPAAS